MKFISELFGLKSCVKGEIVSKDFAMFYFSSSGRRVLFISSFSSLFISIDYIIFFSFGLN